MIIGLLHIFAIICVAHTCGKIIAKLKLPSILGWLIAGIVFGPYLAEVVSFDSTLASIVSGTIVAAAIINEVIAVIFAKLAFKWAGEIK